MPFRGGVTARNGKPSALLLPTPLRALLQQHCQDCHRPGEAAPFSLLTYKEAADWSAALREAVAQRRMPPWHADPAHGHFRNCRRLSDADRATLLAWVKQGCAEGNPADLPPPRAFVRGWRAGRPDAVFFEYYWEDELR